MKKYFVFLILFLLFFVGCVGHSIKPNNYTKESKRIPTTFGTTPTIPVFLVETNLTQSQLIRQVLRDSKRQINEIFPIYYKGKYKIVESVGEFDKYEDISLHRYIIHYKTIFPTRNSRNVEYSHSYGDDNYQIFIEDVATGLHYEPSIKTSDYQGLLKVYGESLEKERNTSEQ